MIRPWGIQGPELQAVRKACGVSRRALAEASGIKEYRIQQIEREERLWQPWEIAVLITALEGLARLHVSLVKSLRQRGTR